MANIFRTNTVKLSDGSYISSGQLLNSAGNVAIDWDNQILSGNNWTINGNVISTGGGGGGGGTNVQVTGSVNLTTANFTGISGTHVTLSGNSVVIGSTSNSLFIKTVTGNYNFTSNDYTVLFSGNNLTGTLPSATSNSGLILGIKNIFGSSNLTGLSPIDSSTNSISLILEKALEIQSDGTQWWLIGHEPTGFLTGVFSQLNAPNTFTSINGFSGSVFSVTGSGGLFSFDGHSGVDWNLRYLSTANGLSIDWGQSLLWNVENGTKSADWSNGYLYDLTPVISLNWFSRTLNGTWNSTGLQVLGIPVVTTTYPYFLSTNTPDIASGSITFVSGINVSGTSNFSGNILISGNQVTTGGPYIPTGQLSGFAFYKAGTGLIPSFVNSQFINFSNPNLSSNNYAVNVTFDASTVSTSYSISGKTTSGFNIVLDTTFSNSVNIDYIAHLYN